MGEVGELDSWVAAQFGPFAQDSQLTVFHKLSSDSADTFHFEMNGTIFIIIIFVRLVHANQTYALTEPDYSSSWRTHILLCNPSRLLQVHEVSFGVGG